MTCKWMEDDSRRRYHQSRRYCERSPEMTIEMYRCTLCDQEFFDVDDVVEHVTASDCFRHLREDM